MTLEKRDLLSKRIGEIIEKNVSLIERNIIKSGDIVYCKLVCEDVVYLEGPEEKFLGQYHNLRRHEKYPPFSGDVICKKVHGKIRKCGIADIVRISSGSYFADFKVNGRGKKVRRRMEYLEYLARSFGFRVEKNKRKEGFLLRFFGDTQKIVDDFVSLCCNNDYIIW